MSQPILDQRISQLAQFAEFLPVEGGDGPDQRDLVVQDVAGERGGDQFIEQARVEAAWLDLSARMFARTLRLLER